MAAGSSGEKSEKPTTGKLRKARNKGDIPRSKDVTMAAGLITSFFVMTTCFPYYKSLIGESFQSIALMAGKLDDSGAMEQFMLRNVLVILKLLATLVPIPAVCIIASLVPGGWIFTPNKLIPDFKKISPLSGIKRLFSSSHFTDVLKMMVKCMVLLFILYTMIKSNLADFIYLQSLPLMQALERGFSVYNHILLYLISCIIIFAVIDIPLSKFLFTKKMKMTKQEVKEEYKNNDGNPQIKGRIRQLQRQISLGQINQSVPSADVIITNPTHYAVALKYDPERALAPYIVAKGMDDIALYIREVAGQHQIEIVEFPPLARAIYHTTRINQQIPSQLYHAIAHVLTYVLQIKSWRKGEADKPALNTRMPLPKEVMKHHGEL